MHGSLSNRRSSVYWCVIQPSTEEIVPCSSETLDLLSRTLVQLFAVLVGAAALPRGFHLTCLPTFYFHLNFMYSSSTTMAKGAKRKSITNGTQLSNKPIELAINLIQSPGTRIHLHLTISESTLTLFLTSASADVSQTAAALGSFVYAMPDVRPTPALS